MATKVVKKAAVKEAPKPSPAAVAVAQAIREVESNSDLKVGSGLKVTAAKEVEVPGSKTAVVVFVPYRQHTDLRKVQVQLVAELENKLGKQVVFLAQRRILQKAPTTGNTKKLQKRPRSRTLTAVHDAILDDLVYPAEVSGRRTRVKVDGSRTSKVYV